MVGDRRLARKTRRTAGRTGLPRHVVPLSWTSTYVGHGALRRDLFGVSIFCRNDGAEVTRCLFSVKAVG